MKKYYLTINTQKENHAGSKAVLDCEHIFEECGYKSRPYYYNPSKHNIINKVSKLFQLIRVSAAPKGSILMVSHPLYIRSDYFTFLTKMQKYKNCKVCFLVHDLEVIRKMIKDWERYAGYDVRMFQIADRIIVHNEKMIDYLVNEQQVPREKLINLKLFDYLVDPERIEEFADLDAPGVVVAGNLAPVKSGYVYELPKELNEANPARLYGVNFEAEKMSGDNYGYVGSFDADELPFLLNGKYGLVWDGDSVDSCTGPSGAYVQYNNPHKVSLYVASGIPVIIWDKAALKDFIVDNKIGIAVSSLKNLGEVLSKISEEEYQQMKANAANMAKRVRNGENLKDAILRMEKSL